LLHLLDAGFGGPRGSQEANPMLERLLQRFQTFSALSHCRPIPIPMFAALKGTGRIVMTVNTSGPIQRATTRTESSLDINKLRVLIAEHLEVDIRRVTDDAHLGRDLGADWLDRLELIILVEEIAGIEMTDNEADRIEVVGHLIHYIDEKRD
jgi:acyl carrier protein